MRARRGRADAALRAPALLFASELLSLLLGNPLGRSLQFNPRRHSLGGLDLDEREHTAIGGDEHIKRFRWTVGDGACAIRLDRIRARDGLVANNIPIKVS